MANTYDTYPGIWETKLQERLNKPTNWKEVAKVMYTNNRVVNVDYWTAASEPSFASRTRGSAFTPTDHQISQDVLTIGTDKIASNFFDDADLAQFDIVGASEAGEMQGSVIAEGIEAAMLADHASWTDFGDTGGGVLGLASTQITVTATNIDDIMRGVREQIITANGREMMDRYGAFIIWRAADKTKLEQFAQANGFVWADYALKNGIPDSYFYGGVYHYVSNSHTANHLFAGVRQLYRIGILARNYGKVVIDQNPAVSGSGGTYGPKWGINVSTAVTYGLLTPTKHKPVLYDINVA